MCGVVPVGACVAVDARSDTVWNMAATGVSRIRGSSCGPLTTNRRCVLADALLVELGRCARFDFFHLPKRQLFSRRRFDENTNAISVSYRNTSPSLLAPSSG